MQKPSNYRNWTKTHYSKLKNKKWVSVKWEKLTEDGCLSGIVEAENEDPSFSVSEESREHFRKHDTHLERLTLSAWKFRTDQKGFWFDFGFGSSLRFKISKQNPVPNGKGSVLENSLENLGTVNEKHSCSLSFSFFPSFFWVSLRNGIAMEDAEHGWGILRWPLSPVL